MGGAARARILLAWSSGKDSAWSLHALRARADVEVVGLLTTVNATHGRVAMHAVRRELLEAQAAAAGLPLHVVEIPSPCPNEVYEAAMARAMAAARARGVTGMAFGDLFLEDVRRYREERLRDTGLTLHFPLWGRPTAELAEEMLAGGLRARLTCVDPRVLPSTFAGREFDRALLLALPPGVDPCGENGEFHSFAYAGPMFRAPLDIATGATVERDGFAFTDLTLNSNNSAVGGSGGAEGARAVVHRRALPEPPSSKDAVNGSSNGCCSGRFPSIPASAVAVAVVPAVFPASQPRPLPLRSTQPHQAAVSPEPSVGRRDLVSSLPPAGERGRRRAILASLITLTLALALPALAAKPQRVASANLSSDEILAEILPPARLVSVTRWVDDDTMSNAVGRVPKSIFRVQKADLESLVALAPDLVVVSEYTDADFQRLLERSGMRVHRMAGLDTLDGVRRAIFDLGRAVGEEAAAAEVVRRYDARLQELRRLLAGAPRPRVLYWSGGMTAGANTAIGALIESAGAVNVGRELGVEGIAPPGAERAFMADPDVILVSSWPGAEKAVAEHPLLSKLRAVQQRRLARLENRFLVALSQHTADAAWRLAELLHPEIVKGGASK